MLRCTGRRMPSIFFSASVLVFGRLAYLGKGMLMKRGSFSASGGRSKSSWLHAAGAPNAEIAANSKAATFFKCVLMCWLPIIR